VFVEAGELLDQVVASGVPHVDPKGKMSLGFSWTSPTRLVLARWYLYPMLSRTAYPRPNGFIESCLPSPVCLFTRRGIENPAAPAVKQEAEEDWGKERC
jgi:hypothetical protein